MSITAIIVQARMTSTRLPGKVLLPLAGDTVLAHVLTRCRAIPGADVVVCAIPEGEAGQGLAEEARRAGAVVVAGDESDVLARYLKAARAVDADVIMRVTSDCPAIDPAICGAVITALVSSGADYACNNMPRGWPHGLDCEAMTRDALERAAVESRGPHEREHVTPWLRTSPGIKRVSVDGPGGKALEGRWTLDHPEDYAFFEALFAHLQPLPHIADYAEIAGVVSAHPELAGINAQHHAAISQEARP
jgi:spore coat polysaccharide biosynthesis protein SpsF (cytidylyltransferase family)